MLQRRGFAALRRPGDEAGVLHFRPAAMVGGGMQPPSVTALRQGRPPRSRAGQFLGFVLRPGGAPVAAGRQSIRVHGRGELPVALRRLLRDRG